MQKENLIDRAKISATASAAIVVVIIGAMAWFFKEMPTKRDVESNEALSLRISTWVKELDAKNIGERVQLEGRLQAQIDKQHADDTLFQSQVLRRLEVIDGDVKDILSRMPSERRAAQRANVKVERL